MITTRDLKQLKEKGIPLHVIEKQIDNFKKGFPYIQLVKPATSGNGILSFREEEKLFFRQNYTSLLPELRVVKFVPASGAASRMFKHLFDFQEKYRMGERIDIDFVQEPGFETVQYFLKYLPRIAFYSTLVEMLGQHGLKIEKLYDEKDFKLLLEFILHEKGFNYANLPKALILFHDYPDGARVSAEEHLVEAARYTPDKQRIARIHFTISPEHLEKFKALFEQVRSKYEQKYQVSFEISYSVQKPSTDILAVDLNNEPFRNADGELLFRPGGHGALLENLNEIDADLVFIKNIDNIIPDRLKEETIAYKELIAGYLLWVREKIFNFLNKAEEGLLSSEVVEEMIQFAQTNLMLSFPQSFHQSNQLEKINHLIQRLSRPIRVCGMVKNEGEPGGGPFWVSQENGQNSLQIVESSQVNLQDPQQNKIWHLATYFNPVDLVCSFRDHHGKKYQLTKYTDEKTGFISLKSSGGRNLKAQELPGLWNGSMAAWLTIFVEVPIITFNPVKTVNDLLRKEHLPCEL